jgi:hypothetical protein
MDLSGALALVLSMVTGSTGKLRLVIVKASSGTGYRCP